MPTVKYSVSAYIADGTTTDYLITWDYLDEDHITVEVDGLSNADPTASHTFTKLNDTTVRVTDGIGGAIATGKEIQIRRNTPITTRPISFSDGSALLAADLNKNSDYLLFSMQEALDQVDFTVQFQQEAEAFRDETEALRDQTQTYLSTVQADEVSADNHRIAAALSETNAAASETNAAASEAAAAVSETNAATSETNLQTAQNNAASSAAAAAASETAAAASETAAATSAANAAGSEAGVAADAATATTKAAAASTSEANALTYKNNAAASATNASNSATASANSATASANSAVQASNSENAAATSRNTASTYATNAQASAVASEASNVASASSATASANSATQAATSEANALSSANAAATAINSAQHFLDTYYISNNQPSGSTVTVGDLWFDSSVNVMKVFGQSGWQSAGSSVNGTAERKDYTATAGQTSFAATFDPTYCDVFLNGVKLAPSDFTATDGANVVLGSPAASGDNVSIVSFGTFELADHYNKITVDALIDDVETLALAGI
jgi:hypothetical protein